MNHTLRPVLTVGLLCAGVAGATLPAAANTFEDKLAGVELLEALRAGGHVIFIRHTTTEVDYADQIDAVMGDCSTQRTLSEAGWQEAKQIGDAIAELEIPIGEVISSEYCRAWQTASLAFDRYEKTSDLNFAPAENYSDEQWASMKEGMTPHLTSAPEQGTNTVLVGHDDPFEAATGVYPEPMGVAFVVTPDGAGGFELVASLEPDEWSALAE